MEGSGLHDDRVNARRDGTTTGFFLYVFILAEPLKMKKPKHEIFGSAEMKRISLPYFCFALPSLIIDYVKSAGGSVAEPF